MTDQAKTDQAIDVLGDDALLDAFLDTLIPPSDEMPGAGSLGLAAALRQQIGSNPAFAAPVCTALGALRDAALARDPGGLPALSPEAREEVFAALLPQQPVLGMFQMFVFTNYYQHPIALKGLGLPGGAPFPNGYKIEPTDASLLAKLTARQRT